MPKSKKIILVLFSAVFFVGLCLLFFVRVSPAEQSIEWIDADKDSFLVNQPTTVLVTTKIAEDANLISTGVNLLRYNMDGRPIARLGRMYDDGTHGDSLAGDNIFTTQVNFEESESIAIFLRVSVAYRRTLRRLLSEILSIQVKLNEEPEKTILETELYLRNGDVSSALTKFQQTQTLEVFFQSLNSEQLNELADIFKNAKLIKAKKTYKIYKAEFLDKDGNLESSEFTMVQNKKGEWKIAGF